MADYAIGDVQGCYDALLRLLTVIDFNDREDRLWFVGDLVNRGPESLKVLEFIHALPVTPRITLGNHDLHLLSHLFCDNGKRQDDDTLDAILMAPHGEELGHWLRRQSILIHDETLNIVMCHAGIAPCLTLAKAHCLARELEEILSGETFRDFLSQMYGNEPSLWHESLCGIERLRLICNMFTRMRYCDAKGRLILTEKGPTESAPHLYPWFDVPHRKPIQADLVFGHWAALQGRCATPHLYALDTGCLWGGTLTALRLQDRQRFQVACQAGA